MSRKIEGAVFVYIYYYRPDIERLTVLGGYRREGFYFQPVFSLGDTQHGKVGVAFVDRVIQAMESFVVFHEDSIGQFFERGGKSAYLLKIPIQFLTFHIPFQHVPLGVIAGQQYFFSRVAPGGESETST